MATKTTTSASRLPQPMPTYFSAPCASFLYTAKLLAACGLTTRPASRAPQRSPRRRASTGLAEGVSAAAGTTGLAAPRGEPTGPAAAFLPADRAWLSPCSPDDRMRTPGSTTLVAANCSVYRHLAAYPCPRYPPLNDSLFRTYLSILREVIINAPHNEFVSVTVFYEKFWVPRLFSNILYIRHAPYTRRAPYLHHAPPSPHMVCLPSLYG